MQSTLSLFEQLVNNIPPLFPEEIKYQIKKDCKIVQENEVTLKELEDVMIKYGYEIWPWNQAFKKILLDTEEKVGEQFLMANLPVDLQEKYLEYKQLGIDRKDFYSGQLASYFDDEQRVTLNVALVDTRGQVRDFAIREVVGLKKELYLKKVEEFISVLEKIKYNLNRLKDLAKKEEDHAVLADEIRARIESFEHGLCLLAPEFSHEEVEKAHDFYVGRKQELNHLRGIQKTIKIDFYNSEV